MKFLGLLLAFSFAFPMLAWSADESSIDPKELEIARRAKRRFYAGGSDESDLRVQVGTPPPTRKVSPTIEEAPDESAAGQTD